MFVIVNNLSIAFMVITFILSVGFPLGLVIYFYKKERISIKAVFIGALMFFLFQIILRIPALTFIQNQLWYQSFAVKNLALTVIMLAFTAALFETVGRFIGLRYILRKKLDRKNGIAYGIGHGGIEAILLVGLSYAANIIYSLLINAGVADSSLVPQLLSTPPSLFLLAGIERAFAILFHIAAALLVTYGIMKNKKIYIFYSFMFHFLLDGVLVVLQISGMPIWAIELWAALIGILSLVFIIKSKSIFPAPDVENDNISIEDEDIKNGYLDNEEE